MKLTTPAIASAPYNADAPSVNNSTRSIADNGIKFRSKPAWDWNTTAGAMGSKVDNPTRGAKNAVNYMNAVLCGEYKFGGVNSTSNAVQ
jgi:hypothetical protein